DGSGNVYVAGYETVSGQGSNVWVRKYNGDGNVIWTKTYNGAANGSDAANGIVLDGSGNVYVAGYETVSGQGLNVWVRKYDGDGNVVWTKTYDGADNDRDISNSIALDGSGNVFVIGSETVTGQDRNIWIRKYDGSGSELWTRTYNGISDGRDEGNGIAVDENGNVYVTGYETVSGQLANVWVRKYDSGGNEVWTETYNNETENGWEVGYGIVVDSSGNVYVGGYENTSSQATNVWARKYQP
ncbi:MAG: SBBP repeat-containing protein, partial [Candidatus Margulisiibacteriota bacterium]